MELPVLPRSQLLLTIAASVGVGVLAKHVYDRLTDDGGRYNTSSASRSTFSGYNLSEANLKGARTELQNLLGRDATNADPRERLSRAGNQWSPASTDQMPDLVVFPGSTADVSQIMKICSRRRIPVMSYSGGTSLGGALAAVSGGICIDFQRMNKILAVHKPDMDVVVQPAVGWQELNSQLAELGLFFPPDPGPGARIGGMIAMNCSGTNTYRYGPMKNWVVSTTFVLADGSVVKSRQRPRKSSAGYDLTRLMVGSEGTLALVTEAVIKVALKPGNLHVVLSTFTNIRAAINTALALVNSGIPVEALEFIDHFGMKAINKSKLSSRSFKELPTLFLKFAGSQQEVQDQIRATERAAQENHCESLESFSEERDIEAVWAARKVVVKALFAMMERPTDVFKSSDAAVPLSRFADLIEWFQEVVLAKEFYGSLIGHAGDGNIHAAIICTAEQEAAADELVTEIQRKALELEGTITGEHGIGLKLRDMLAEEVGDSGVEVMRKIKMALDPKGILNHGKVIQLERIAGRKMQE